MAVDGQMVVGVAETVVAVSATASGAFALAARRAGVSLRKAFEKPVTEPLPPDLTELLGKLDD